LRAGVLHLENSNAPAVNSVLKKLGFSPLLTSNPDDLSSLSHLIIPGVGSFAAVAQEVRNINSLPEALFSFAQSGKPILGICLGMQLLGNSSEESPGIPGLGIIDFEVVAMKSQDSQFPIPHVGWNQAKITIDNPLFEGIPTETDFYFSHSFQVTDSRFRIAETKYSELFASSVRKEKIFGVQFHPERSQEYGHRILQNFLGM
jgi:glutamine amidotransferase